MIITWLLLAAVGLGHGCILILLVNCCHGLGVRSRWLERATVLAGLLAAALTVLAGVSVSRTDVRDWPAPVRGYAAVCLAVGLVGLPAATIARHARRVPAGIAGSTQVVDLATGRDPAVYCGPGRRSWWLRLPGNESFRLEVNEWTIDRPDWPDAFDGMRILHLSDLHLARTFDRRFFEAALDLVADCDADLVLFTGDLVDDEAVTDWIEPLLSRVRGRLDSYAILGNHDYQYAPETLCGELERAGYTVIEGRWRRLNVRGATLAIGGTSAPWGPPLDPAEMPEADARLLLCHTPDLLTTASAWGVDLMFSGHNHGGQVCLPVLGPVLMPSRYSRRYDQGFFRMGPTLLYVSRGVAAKHPVRYGCLPEVARFTIRVRVEADETDRGIATGEPAGDEVVDLIG
jgi:predicted MPP superfamily phosphohydrolase